MEIKKEVRELALQAAMDNNLPCAYVNDKGEVFTSENLASLSVGGKAEKFTAVNAEPIPSKDETGEVDGSANTSTTPPATRSRAKKS